MIKKTNYLIVCFAWVLLLWQACSPKTGQGTTGNGTGETLTVLQPEASSGDLLILQSNLFKNKQSLKITINGATAVIVASTESEATVVVPKTKPGTAKIIVFNGTDKAAETTVEIIEGATTTLTMVMANGSVSLKGKENTNQQFVQYLGVAGRVLIYEITDGNNTLLVTGSVPHPQEKEVLVDEKGNLTHESTPPETSTMFMLTIPNIKSATTITLYDANADVLTNQELYKQKKQISQLSIK